MKYRGKVINNQDPMKMGRIKVYCPLIYGNSESAWCYPCIPLGFEYHIPQVGQMVWIEFEKDDISSTPIYVGTWGEQDKWIKIYEE